MRRTGTENQQIMWLSACAYVCDGKFRQYFKLKHKKTIKAKLGFQQNLKIFVIILF
jgi:hypothetical protein